MAQIKDFLDANFRHFNAAALVDAAKGWIAHVDSGGTMMLTMGGAMSSAELGISVAELIRRDKIHGLTVTGANLEEDVYNLIAHESYQRIPHYRHLSAQDEADLRDRGMNRVTDTCIPEDVAMRKIERHMVELWNELASRNERLFPHQLFYRLLLDGKLRDSYQIDPKNSWLLAAAEKNLPIWVPGWEDSTLGNMYVANKIRGRIPRLDIVKTGPEYMEHLVGWYQETQKAHAIGFFQIGGGISGDFPICVVPLIHQDLEGDARYWGYFCQISEATTSYGSYSGAVPNEKISWGKLDTDTPRFIIESDASIVFPLVAAYVLNY